MTKEQTWQERFKLKLWNVYATIFQLSLYDDKQLEEKEDVMVKFLEEIIDETREETLKELIREYQDNELDGKGYDFYFSIRAKIDELNKLKK